MTLCLCFPIFRLSTRRMMYAVHDEPEEPDEIDFQSLSSIAHD